MRGQFTYSKKVLSHFRKPHNLGNIKNPSGLGEVGNLACGDVMKLYLKIEDDKIEEIKFETYGCAAAIATSSVITDLVKGKTIEEALKMTNKEVIDSLDGLPPIKIHCSLLSVDALGEAIYDYLVKNNREIPKELEERHRRITTLADHH
ncbi:MAG TPA: iron-sulfur cluster assembly scaffold protein [Candidatus Woesebacteria bacterium]|nr:iron-sulfur cluster assembly scaffold protein [Candidatus Woesebacteria bacterium]HPJ17235.1 iron-sulfur cluster assembly scaffold protein [Candidatus Woesebacteria bacterium]